MATKGEFPMGLQMKYFVLKPRSKYKDDPYAHASRAAMAVYASWISKTNPQFAEDLLEWVTKESMLHDEMQS